MLAPTPQRKVEMMYRKWTKEEDEFLKREYGKKQAEDVARELGRSKSSVCSRAAGMGLSGRRGIWSEDDVSFLKEKYLELGAKETARQLGRTVGAVHTKILEVGGGRETIGPKIEWSEDELEYLRENYQKVSLEEIERNLDRTRAAILARAQMIGIKRYFDPHEFFDTWTEESAYTIGFFAADGWATKRGPQSIRIGFAQKGSDILYKIKNVIGAGRITNKNDGMSQYYIQSVRIYDRLCEIFGQDVCRKSNVLQWPSVPAIYVRHFVRGAFDGDGCITRKGTKSWEASYTTGSKFFAESLCEKVLGATGIELRTGLNRIGVYHVVSTGIKTACFADWLYGDSHISLERKRVLAERVISEGGTYYSKSVTDKMKHMFPDIFSRYEVIA